MIVLVVGGGITGLATTYALARAGIPVRLVEASDRLGGKISTEHVDGFTIEAGPDSVLATRPAALELAREVGLGSQLIGVSEPRGVSIWHRERLVPMPDGLGLVLPTKVRPFAFSPLFSPVEKLRMAFDLVMPRVMSADDEAVGAFLRRRLGDALVERLAGPLVGGVYGTPIDELSLDAVIPTLRTSEREHRSLLLAGLAQGRAQRRAMEAARRSGGSGRPSLGLFVSLAGGMSTLVEGVVAAIERLPAATVSLRTPLTSMESVRGGHVAHLATGEDVHAEAVVLTLPSPRAAALVESVVPEAAAVMRAIRHGSTAIVTLAFDERQFDAVPAGHGFLAPDQSDLSICAATISSSKWTGRAPAGTVLIRAFLPDGPLLGEPDGALTARAIADVRRTLGAHGEPLLTRCARSMGDMPRYTVGHLSRLAVIDAALAGHPGIILAGAPYKGVGIPDCVAQGRAAAARVAELLSGPVSRDAEAQRKEAQRAAGAQPDADGPGADVPEVDTASAA